MLIPYHRKKKKSKAKEVLDTLEKVEEKAEGAEVKPKKTPAELAFMRIKEKRVSYVVE